jgi:cell wall-associated NlpC family hydrolase
MFGHSLPEAIYEELKARQRAYIGNHEGKPVVREALGTDTVAVVLFRVNDDVDVLSDVDRAEMNAVKLPFVLIGNDRHVTEAYMPDRYTEHRPYVNRPFWHGVFDCYTLLRDVFRREWGMWLPMNVHRPFGWWETGDNHYVDKAAEFGFYRASAIKRFDVLIMRMSSVPNHGALALGNGMILHHLGGRFSCVEPLSAALKRHIAVIYRNRAVEQKLAADGDRRIKGIDD